MAKIKLLCLDTAIGVDNVQNTSFWKNTLQNKFTTGEIVLIGNPEHPGLAFKNKSGDVILVGFRHHENEGGGSGTLPEDLEEFINEIIDEKIGDLEIDYELLDSEYSEDDHTTIIKKVTSQLKSLNSKVSGDIKVKDKYDAIVTNIVEAVNALEYKYDNIKPDEFNIDVFKFARPTN